MLPTVVETAEYQARVGKILSAQERDDFNAWIAANPLAGDVIVGASGLRKVRVAAAGKGKSGGARVIYLALLDDGTVLLLTIYAKADRASMTASELAHKRKKAGI